MLERYRQISSELHDEPASYPSFYAGLSHLQSMGLILLVSTKVGRAYTKRIDLLLDRDLLEAIWRIRVG